MPPDFEIVDIPPEQKPLIDALRKCGLRTFLILETATRLTEPPASLHLPAPSRIERANTLINDMVEFDGDMAAQMLRREEGQPDPGASWKALSRAERKRARNLWAWTLDTGFETAPQGRPHMIDGALVLYCSRVIAAACGQSRFKFSRPPGGGSPYGPGWRALMAALPLAERFLTRIDGNRLPELRDLGDRAETIADIVKTARSKGFDEQCRRLQLGPTFGDVAQHPAAFRHALMLARSPRRQVNRT
jgi:hypothetical protein